jgi:oligoendopeptidase F
LDFLKLGGSQYPLDELRQAGVDMQSTEPIERTIHHFENLLSRLIEEHQSI